ncbi:serine hydrolase domain-containing protein [Actinosynnema sp. NPDC050436]|uniref:serine hydrolase domain-containing protein n=1 Tax=Actinosynnema sp. NPDC050436 TaxID=3155659 RepID=UPI003407F056
MGVLRGVGLLCVAFALGACTGGGAAPPSSGPSSGTPAQALAKRLEQHVGSLDRLGFRGVVEVHRDGELLLSRAFGPAEVSTTRPNTPATRFRIGSVTKQVTALALLVLEERGALRLTDPLCAHLPGCPPEWAAIAVGHLLDHTSGLVNYLALPREQLVTLLGDRPSHLELVHRMRSWPLTRPPGTEFEYSNTGYVAAGALIEHLSGESYESFLRRTVLDPLGMGATTTAWDETDPAGRAVGYTDATTPADLTSFPRYSDGSLSSTTADLHRWNTFLLTANPPLVTRATLDRMTTPNPAVKNAGDPYGYGLQLHKVGSETSVEHSGGLPGFLTYNGFHRGTRSSVTVVSNLGTTDPDNIGHGLMDLAARR